MLSCGTVNPLTRCQCWIRTRVSHLTCGTTGSSLICLDMVMFHRKAHLQIWLPLFNAEALVSLKKVKTPMVSGSNKIWDLILQKTLLDQHLFQEYNTRATAVSVYSAAKTNLCCFNKVMNNKVSQSSDFILPWATAICFHAANNGSIFPHHNRAQ